jgi:hypothetical protein
MNQKRNFTVYCITLICLLMSSGCMTVEHTYLNPKFPTVTKADLQPTSKPGPIDLKVLWQTNSKEKIPPRGVEKLITRLMESSGCFSSINLNGTQGECRLEILINNHGDMGSAYCSGILTGLTLGTVGAEVTDFYTFTAICKMPKQPDWKCQYEHALISTIGLKSGPEGLEPMTSDQAFTTVIKQLVFKMLKDMQDQQIL